MSDLSQIQIPSMRERVSRDEWATRCDLAACYRLVHHFGMDDLVYNHISARVPGEEGHFLINAYGMTYDEVSASSLVKIDFDGNVVLDSGTGLGINRAGFVIHSAVHRPAWRCRRWNAACCR
jgi:ribulose-5-phosphate 4-epimerase/fuculose-1-phosphate aldolase